MTLLLLFANPPPRTGSASLTLPMLNVSAAGQISVTGLASFLLPMLQLLAEASTTPLAGADSKWWILPVYLRGRRKYGPR